VNRFLYSYEMFLRELDNGYVYVSKKHTNKIFELLESDDDEAIQRLIDEGKAEKYESKDFRDELRKDLEHDLEILKEVKQLWQQVRRMVEGLLAVGKGALSVEELKSMLDGREKHSMRPSPADGLFLVDTKYLSFRFRPDARARKRFVGYLKSLKHPRYGVMAAPLCRKGFV